MMPADPDDLALSLPVGGMTGDDIPGWQAGQATGP
jgi:hypothetical protein